MKGCFYLFSQYIIAEKSLRYFLIFYSLFDAVFRWILIIYEQKNKNQSTECLNRARSTLSPWKHYWKQKGKRTISRFTLNAQLQSLKKPSKTSLWELEVYYKIIKRDLLGNWNVIVIFLLNTHDLCAQRICLLWLLKSGLASPLDARNTQVLLHRLLICRQTELQSTPQTALICAVQMWICERKTCELTLGYE